MDRMLFAQERRSFLQAIGFLVAIILVLGALGVMEGEDKKVEDARYCYQVALNKADPTQGWPDVDKKYDSICAGAGLKPGFE